MVVGMTQQRLFPFFPFSRFCDDSQSDGALSREHEVSQKKFFNIYCERRVFVGRTVILF